MLKEFLVDWFCCFVSFFLFWGGVCIVWFCFLLCLGFLKWFWVCLFSIFLNKWPLNFWIASYFVNIKRYWWIICERDFEIHSMPSLNCFKCRLVVYRELLHRVIITKQLLQSNDNKNDDNNKKINSCRKLVILPQPNVLMAMHLILQFLISEA